eukprot:GFUD01029679.1.p1 GENE.GFUD01029679.1~~GFUD01029679.1.p1  ORF type:complete len:562 (+),score=149.73 GFUD01029679.1:180-1865(+)
MDFTSDNSSTPSGNNGFPALHSDINLEPTIPPWSRIAAPSATNNCSLHELPVPSSSTSELDSLLEDPNNSCMHQLPVTNGDKLSNNGGQDMVDMFNRAPLRITRAIKQYMYDDNGVEFLDCVNGTAHVGHCHPQVVSTGQSQMAKLVTAQGFVSDILKKYVKQLVETLPEPLSVCYLTNSGSEANDLALRLATSYTEREDVVVVEDGYHGNLGILVDISPKMHSKIPGYNKKDNVHITKLPDQFRGKYRYGDEDAGLKYAREVEKTILLAEAKGRKIAAFICEPMFVIPGVFPTPPSYFKHVYKTVREHGGLVIADEVQTGLGRTGNHMWGFMNYEVVPDIVTIGKPLGNGHPMGAVVCSREVSDKLGGYFSTFGGNPVSCAIGLSVFEIIKNEKLVSSAKMVGRHLYKSLQELQSKHRCLGDVRGAGLVQGLEIVNNKEERIPAANLATEIMYELKMKQVLVGITGRDKNVILFTPPMCFTIENSRRFAKCFDEVLASLEPRTSSIDVRPRSVIVTNKAGSKRSIIENPKSRVLIELDNLNDSKKGRISENEEDHYGDMD